MIDFLDTDIAAYVTEKSAPEPPILAEIRRNTYLKTLYPRMVSGHFQGRVLSFLSHLIRPERILEIGTFTGYSAICMAEGMVPEGRITTLEKNTELKVLIDEHLEKAGIRDRVDVKYGIALDILPQLTETYDLIFIDADKQNYLRYYEAVLPRLHRRGLLLADNVLWGGKVLTEKESDKETNGLREFNNFVEKDPRVEQLLLPIRDGIMLVRKKL